MIRKKWEEHSFNLTEIQNTLIHVKNISLTDYLLQILNSHISNYIKHKILTDSNFDDYALQPGDDREFTNQFTEFLQKNTIIEEPKKKEKKTKKNTKSTLEYFINEDSVTQ